MKTTLASIAACACLLFPAHGGPAVPAQPDEDAVGCQINLSFTYKPAEFPDSPDLMKTTLGFRTQKRKIRRWRYGNMLTSQVRIKSGWWAELGKDRRRGGYYYELEPGETFQRAFELRQGCNANRKYRFHFWVGGDGVKTRTYTHYFPDSGYRSQTSINLGNVARLFADK